MAVVTSKPNTLPIALVSRGVASEKVVAVAQTTAKIAIISIPHPIDHLPYHQRADDKLQRNADAHAFERAS